MWRAFGGGLLRGKHLSQHLKPCSSSFMFQRVTRREKQMEVSTESHLQCVFKLPRIDCLCIWCDLLCWETFFCWQISWVCSSLPGHTGLSVQQVASDGQFSPWRQPPFDTMDIHYHTYTLCGHSCAKNFHVFFFNPTAAVFSMLIVKQCFDIGEQTMP